MDKEQLRLGNLYSDRIKEYETELKQIRELRKNEESGHNIEMALFQEVNPTNPRGCENFMCLRYNFLYWHKEEMLDKYEAKLEEAIAEEKLSLSKL